MMAARIDGPAYRSHAALKFAAGVARVFAVLIVAATFIGAIAAVATNSGSVISPTVPPFPVGVSGALAVLFLVIGLIYAVLFWAAADALIMLADGDDAHRRTQFELAELGARLDALILAEARAEVQHSTDATERLTPPS